MNYNTPKIDFDFLNNIAIRQESVKRSFEKSLTNNLLRQF